MFVAKIKILGYEPAKVASDLRLRYLPQEWFAGHPALLGVPKLILGDSHEQTTMVFGPRPIGSGKRFLLPGMP